MFSHLPYDYEFPQAGAYDCWIKWNIGDTVRVIPPLRISHAKDFAFMDKQKPGIVQAWVGHFVTPLKCTPLSGIDHNSLTYFCVRIWCHSFLLRVVIIP
jgi:hypothetical protein